MQKLFKEVFSTQVTLYCPCPKLQLVRLLSSFVEEQLMEIEEEMVTQQERNDFGGINQTPFE
jgi:hypothetical protein